MLTKEKIRRQKSEAQRVGVHHKTRVTNNHNGDTLFYPTRNAAIGEQRVRVVQEVVRTRQQLAARCEMPSCAQPREPRIVRLRAVRNTAYMTQRTARGGCAAGQVCRLCDKGA